MGHPTSRHYIVPLLGVAVTMTLFAIIVARFQKSSTGVMTINVSRAQDQFVYAYTNLGSFVQTSSQLTVLATASVVELYQTDATNQRYPLSFDDSVRVQYMRHGQTIRKEEYEDAISRSTSGLMIRLSPPGIGNAVNSAGHTPVLSVATTKDLLQSVF